MPDYDDFDDPRQAADEETSLDVFEDDTTSADDGPERDRNAVRRPGRPQRDPDERPVDETVDTAEHAPEGTTLDTTELTGRDLSGRPTGLDALGIHSQGFGAPSSGGGEDPRSVEARRGKVGDGPPKRGRDPLGKRDSRGRHTGNTEVDPDDVDTSDGTVFGRGGFTTKFDAQSQGDGGTRHGKTEHKDGRKESWTDNRDSDGNGVYRYELTNPNGTTFKVDVGKLGNDTAEVTTKTKPDGSKTEDITVQSKNKDGSTTTTTSTKTTDKEGKTTTTPEKTTTTPPSDPKTTPVDPITDDPAPSIYDPLTGEIPIEVQREMDLKLGIGVAHDEPGHNTAEGDGRGVRIRYPDESDGGGKPYVDPTLINPVNPAVEQELTPPGSEELTVGAVDLVTDPVQAGTASHGVDGGIVPAAPSSSSQQESGDPLLDPNAWLGDGAAPTTPTAPPAPDPVAATAEAPAPQVGPSPAEGQPGDFAGPPDADAPDMNAASADEPGHLDDAI